MARPAHLNIDDVLRFLQVRNDPVALEELARSLHLKKSLRRPLVQMLEKLQRKGLVEQLSHGRYLYRKTPRPALPADKRKRDTDPEQIVEKFSQHKVTSRDEIRGRLVLHQDGYGFVVPDVALPNLDGDIFIPKDHVEDAMHGDTVIAKLARLSGTPSARRAEGRIVRVIGRAHPSIVGLFRFTCR